MITENLETKSDLAEETRPRTFEDDIQDISLRDYFAAQALAAVIDASEDDLDEAEDFGSFAFDCARRSYALADAMMVARDLEFMEPDDEGRDDEESEEEVATDGHGVQPEAPRD